MNSVHDLNYEILYQEEPREDNGARDAGEGGDCQQEEFRRFCLLAFNKEAHRLVDEEVAHHGGRKDKEGEHNDEDDNSAI